MTKKLTAERFAYKPIEYPKAEEYWRAQTRAHWTHWEVSLANDINDWATGKLTPDEMYIVERILAGFTQFETLVGDYWRQVPTFFPKPEIAAMSAAFSGMEAIHLHAYHYLMESLGISDFSALESDVTAMAKFERLLQPAEDLDSRAFALANFSAFAEGVQLFSLFAVLMSLSRSNVLKNVAKIVEFSVRDESLHSEAGCWLFRTLCDENPGLLERVAPDINAAASAVYDVEAGFIDSLFEGRKMRGIDPERLKEYVKFRVNTKLTDLGLSPVFVVDSARVLNKFEWFDVKCSGTTRADFFAGRVTEYAKVTGYTTGSMFGGSDD